MSTPISCIIGKTIAYAAKVGGGVIANRGEILLLDDGAIAVFTERGTLVTTATTAASLNNVQQFYVAVGSIINGVSNPFIIQTDLIDRDAHIQENCTYVAPVIQKIVIGKDGAGIGAMNFPVALVPGSVAVIRIAERLPEYQPNTFFNYEHVVTSVDTTETIIQALADSINLDSQKWTATVLLNAGIKVGILITAADLDITFGVSGDEILINATVALTGGSAAAKNFGKGTPAQLTEIEKESFHFQGSQNYIEYQAQMFKQPSKVDYTALYNFITLQWTQENGRVSGKGERIEKIAQFWLPNGSAVWTDLNTIFTGAPKLLLSSTTSSGTSQ